MIWVLQQIIEHRADLDFAGAGIRLFGIGLAMASFLAVPHVPSLIGNLLWGTALFSQVVVPVSRAWLKFRNESSAAITD